MICCEKLRINGILCHEIGCTDSWRDYEIDCKECGISFLRSHSREIICEGCFEANIEIPEIDTHDFFESRNGSH